MKLKRQQLFLIAKTLGALVALFTIMAWASGALQRRLAGGSIETEQGMQLPAGGSILTAALKTVPEYVPLSGTVFSERQITLSARLPAFVESVYVNAGDRVPEGKLLLALDQRELLEQLAAAQAALQQAQTAFQRSERLLETHATTPQAHEAAESHFRTAKAEAEQVQVMLSYTRIKAPIDGIVSDRFVEAGDLASMGQPLVTIFDPKRLRIQVPVPTSLIHLFPVDAEIPVTLDQETNICMGTVTEIVSAFDPVTRTRRVKLRLAVTADTVLPGMYGHVKVPARIYETILLPPRAIETIGQLESVLIVTGGRLQRRLVRTGPAQQNMISILSGLHPGDQIWVPAEQQATEEGATTDGEA